MEPGRGRSRHGARMAAWLAILLAAAFLAFLLTAVRWKRVLPASLSASEPKARSRKQQVEPEQPNADPRWEVRSIPRFIGKHSIYRIPTCSLGDDDDDDDDKMAGCMVGGKRVMVLDTETTGFPPWAASIDKTKAWDCCRMVQLAWAVHDESGRLLAKQDHIVKPEGWVIPEDAARVHGITTGMATAFGIPIQQVLEALHSTLADFDVGTLVAHNMQFDDSVLQAEMWRCQELDLLTRFQLCERRCTMLMGTAPGKKWPTLAELYRGLFATSPQRCHQADADVEYCSRIYWHIMKNHAD